MNEIERILESDVESRSPRGSDVVLAGARRRLRLRRRRQLSGGLAALAVFCGVGLALAANPGDGRTREPAAEVTNLAASGPAGIEPGSSSATITPLDSTTSVAPPTTASTLVVERADDTSTTVVATPSTPTTSPETPLAGGSRLNGPLCGLRPQQASGATLSIEVKPSDAGLVATVTNHFAGPIELRTNQGALDAATADSAGLLQTSPTSGKAMYSVVSLEPGESIPLQALVATNLCPDSPSQLPAEAAVVVGVVQEDGTLSWYAGNSFAI